MSSSPFQPFRARVIARILAGLMLSFLPVHASGGTIEGRVIIPNKTQGKRIAIEKYNGKISGKVAPKPMPSVGIWLSAPGLKAPANPPDVLFVQRGYQFEKSLITVPKNTRIYFPNEDNDYHNVFSLSRPYRFDLGRYKKGEQPAPSYHFSKTGLVILRCEIHEHMRATVLVVDSPYVTTTNTQGHFRLTHVPAGNYTLHGQLDKKTKWSAKVSVQNGKLTKIGPLR